MKTTGKFSNMAISTGFKILMFAITFASWSQQESVTRYGLFRKLYGTLLKTEFILRQIKKISIQICIKMCFFDKKCVSFAYGNFICVLYSTDPREQLDESSLIRTIVSPLTMYIISSDDAIPCNIGNLAAYSYSDLEKCGFDEKTTDSNCGDEWSSWKLDFDTICDGNATFVRRKTQSKNCTRPLFGGKTWNCSENWSKKPMNLQVSVSTFNEAKSMCGNLGKEIFTGAGKSQSSICNEK